jgi:competence protein ComEA
MFFTKKSWWKDYFSFSKKERIGVFILSGAILLTVIVPKFFTHKKPDIKVIPVPANVAVYEKQNKNELVNSDEQQDDIATYKTNQYTAVKESEDLNATLHYFDPNTITEDEWQALGVKSKTAHTISNYLGKGGKFRKPEDILKVYGLSRQLAQRLLPYIKIENQQAANNSTTFQSNYIKKESITLVDVNLADTAAFIALPGIGSKLAMRIITFRDKLGGFYDINQVGETYGLADSVFQRLKPRLQLGASQVKQININTAGVDELKAHPYIKWNLANVIVQYRQQHGNYTHISQLQQITIITPDVYKKLEPYITIN